jgi:hypothetical protein
MIYPTDEEVLAGVVTALKDSVLPELARGSAARKQLQAALEILHRISYAMPRKAPALEADNADMAETIERVRLLLARHSPPPNLPHQGGGTRISEALPLDGGGLGGGDDSASPAERNIALQTQLVTLQGQAIDPEITALLIALHKRMTDRALALVPPPMPRTPRKTS